MMSLSANMDLRNSRINYLAKAKMDFDFSIPPSKDGGNSDGAIQSIGMGFSPFSQINRNI